MQKMILTKAHYKAERSLSFEKYVAKLTGAFQVLAHYDEPYPNDKKVRTLLLKMNTNDPHINAGIAHDSVVSYLADIIRLAPSSQTQVKWHRHHHAAHSICGSTTN
jgi:hypothetical protein